MKINNLILAALISSALLTGCDNSKSGNESTSSQSTPAAKQDAANLNAYIAISNRLQGVGGLSQAQDEYKSMDVDHAKSDKIFNEFPKIDYDFINQQFSTVKENSQLSSLDTSANDLKDKIAAMQKDYKDYSLYYNSAEFHSDKLQKGKAANASISQHFQDASASYKQFQSELDIAYKKQIAADLEKIKASGNLYAYHERAAMNAASDLVSTFKSQEDLSDAAKIKEAGGYADEVTKQLKALEGVKSSNPYASSDSVPGYLTSTVKWYKTFESSKDVGYLKSMVEDYNQAVQASNGN